MVESRSFKMARFLNTQDGQTVGYMDDADKHLFAASGQLIAFWDLKHKYLYTPEGGVYGYCPRCRLVYSQNGKTIGYFEPPYEPEQ